MSFKSVQKKIAGQGHSMASAGAILANASRHASAKAKRANPKLRRVKGGDAPAGLKSPMSVIGGKARMAIGVVPPCQEPRIAEPISYAAGDKPKMGPAGSAKHVKI